MSDAFGYLKQVKSGNREAMKKLVDCYMPLIINNSIYDNLQINEDCIQYIILNVIIAVKRFEPLTSQCHDKNQLDLKH